MVSFTKSVTVKTPVHIFIHRIYTFIPYFSNAAADFFRTVRPVYPADCGKIHKLPDELNTGAARVTIV